MTFKCEWIQKWAEDETLEAVGLRWTEGRPFRESVCFIFGGSAVVMGLGHALLRGQADFLLIALGGANLGSALSVGYHVTGGFARSVVNFDAGAETPAAGAFTAVGMALATLYLTPLLHFLPTATLCCPACRIKRRRNGLFLRIASVPHLANVRGDRLLA